MTRKSAWRVCCKFIALLFCVIYKINNSKWENRFEKKSLVFDQMMGFVLKKVVNWLACVLFDWYLNMQLMKIFSQIEIIWEMRWVLMQMLNFQF